MDRKVQHDSSSSEDEICMEAIREAADQDFLRNLLSKAEKAEGQTCNDPNDLNEDQYVTHGLTQSCRDFIAKKLAEKLYTDIVLVDVDVQTNSGKNDSLEPSGIKLFHSSNAVLTEVVVEDEPKKTCKKNIIPKFDEKANFLRCKEVALDSETILSQQDLKFWVNRKHSQEFKYRKSKNGILLQIE